MKPTNNSQPELKGDKIEELLIEHKEYFEIEINDSVLKKVRGSILAGNKIEITWKERRNQDYGYLFALPVSCGLDDLFYHIPNPDNSDGIDDAPPVWGHFNALILNTNITRILIH